MLPRSSKPAAHPLPPRATSTPLERILDPTTCRSCIFWSKAKQRSRLLMLCVSLCACSRRVPSLLPIVTRAPLPAVATMLSSFSVIKPPHSVCILSQCSIVGLVCFIIIICADERFQAGKTTCAMKFYSIQFQFKTSRFNHFVKRLEGVSLDIIHGTNKKK